MIQNYALLTQKSPARLRPKKDGSKSRSHLSKNKGPKLNPYFSGFFTIQNQPIKRHDAILTPKFRPNQHPPTNQTPPILTLLFHWFLSKRRIHHPSKSSFYWLIISALLGEKGSGVCELGGGEGMGLVLWGEGGFFAFETSLSLRGGGGTTFSLILLKKEEEMAAFLEGATDLEKLHDLCKRTHKEQAVWFLNAFWDDFAKVWFCFYLNHQKGKKENEKRVFCGWFMILLFFSCDYFFYFFSFFSFFFFFLFFLFSFFYFISG